jgi:xylulokinase
MLADISGQLDYRTGGDVGPALGAARLAQIAVEPGTPFLNFCRSCRLNRRHLPDAKNTHFTQNGVMFRRIYQQLLPLMS